MRVPWHLLLAVILITTFSACEDVDYSDDVDTSDTSDDSTSDDTSSDDSTDNTTSDGIALSSVTWLNTDVSSWKQTSTLSVSISGGTITLNYDKANTWPSGSVDGTKVNANPWVFVKLDNKWYAATFEWLRPGQTSKPTSTVDGSHINASPLSSWHPKSGETYGFMVSGLARSSTRNVTERTQVVMAKWP